MQPCKAYVFKRDATGFWEKEQHKNQSRKVPDTEEDKDACSSSINNVSISIRDSDTAQVYAQMYQA